VEEIEPGIGGPSGLERMVFFSDAVFAIVITLLVLPITAEVELDEAGGRLAHQVWALWPRILSFLISFLVIGQFWIAHHRMFGLIRRIDRAMLGINLVGLLTITFLPLPTAILGADTPPGDAFPAVFYAISLSAASFMLAVTWGSSLREIAAALTAEGHPTKRGGIWQANTVRRILRPGGHHHGLRRHRRP
jgi:uncharacterized membrane protein